MDGGLNMRNDPLSELKERVERVEKDLIDVHVQLGNAVSVKDLLKGALWFSWALTSFAVAYVVRHIL
jgi:hypothetical protein